MSHAAVLEAAGKPVTSMTIELRALWLAACSVADLTEDALQSAARMTQPKSQRKPDAMGVKSAPACSVFVHFEARGSSPAAPLA